MKNLWNKACDFVVACVVTLVALPVALLSSGSAQATVPAGVQTVFTDTATDFGTVVGYGWTLFLVIVGGLVMFGIVRRVISRTAGR